MTTKTTPKQMKAGLRQRPTFEQTIGVIEKDKKVKLPDRRYVTLMNSPEHSALVNVPNMDALEEQQMKVLQEELKDNLMKQIAHTTKGLGRNNLVIAGQGSTPTGVTPSAAAAASSTRPGK